MEEPVAPWRCCLVQALAVMVAPCRLRPVLDLLLAAPCRLFQALEMVAGVGLFQ